MNTKTTLFLLLAAVLAGAAVLIVQKIRKDETAGQKPEPAAKPLFEPKPEGIDRVEVALRDGGRRVFAKQGEDWMMLEPLQARATGYEVDTLVRAITDLKYKHVYQKDDEDRPKDNVSGMDKPTAVVRLLKGNEVKADVIVGSRLPTGTGNYIRLAGSDEIRQSENDLSSTFNKRLDSYRDRQVVKLNTSDVKRVRVEGSQNYTLVKSGENWVIESPIRARADKAKADGLVRPLASLYAQEWQTVSPTLAQLDEPRLKLTVDTERTVPARYPANDPAATRPADTQPSVETKTYTLMVGGSTGATSNGFFARMDSSPAVFSLAESTVKELNVPLADLQDRSIAKLEQTRVRKVEVQTGGETATLTKGEKGEWTFADGTPADPAAVEDLINTAADMKATSFTDPRLPQPDMSQPRARIAFTQEGQVEPVAILVGGPTPSGRMVYVRNAAEEPVAAVNEDLIAPLLQPPVSYRDRLVMNVPRERVSKIEIARPNSPPVTLTKAQAKWSMVSPIEAAADNDAVRNILTDLSTLQAKRVAGVGNKAQFGLDSPEVTLAVWIDRVTDLPNAKVVGTQPAATQPSAGTQPAGTQPAGAATRPAFASTQPAELQRRVTTLEGLIEYQRTHPETENKAATEVVKQQLEQARAQLAAAIAATQPAGAATQPSATRPAVATAPAMAAASTQPSGPEVKRLHLAQKDGKTYAALDEGQTVWELDNRVRDDATAEFHDRQIARFDIAQVTDLTLDAGPTALIFRKTGEEWRYMTDPLVPIDRQKITDVLNTLRELKTHRYVSYAATDMAPYGFNEEPAEVIVGLNNGQQTHIRVSAKGPAEDPDKSRYAVLEGSKKVFLLKEDQTRKLTGKLEDFVKSDKPAGGTASLGSESPPPAFGDE